MAENESKEIEEKPEAENETTSPAPKEANIPAKPEPESALPKPETASVERLRNPLRRPRKKRSVISL
jgi:hypothetical protein